MAVYRVQCGHAGQRDGSHPRHTTATQNGMQFKT